MPFVLKAACAAVVLASTHPVFAQDLDAGRAFLRSNADAPDVMSMPGLQYKVLKSGPQTGPRPSRTSAVKVRYEGRGIDGKIFDTSTGKGASDDTVIFVLKMVIPGFQAALLSMRPGDEWEIYVPAELAYGFAGAPKSNQTLIFKLALVDWAEIPADQQTLPLMERLPGK